MLTLSPASCHEVLIWLTRSNMFLKQMRCSVAWKSTSPLNQSNHKLFSIKYTHKCCLIYWTPTWPKKTEQFELKEKQFKAKQITCTYALVLGDSTSRYYSKSKHSFLKMLEAVCVHVKHLRWYWWENMYAGVEEGGGAAAEPEGGIPYRGFEGSTCRDTQTWTLKPCWSRTSISTAWLAKGPGFIRMYWFLIWCGWKILGEEKHTQYEQWCDRVQVPPSQINWVQALSWPKTSVEGPGNRQKSLVPSLLFCELQSWG